MSIPINLVTYADVLLLIIGYGLYILGFRRGEKQGRRDVWQESYQDELNYKVEDLLHKQEKKDD